jgi:hypothetical protein
LSLGATQRQYPGRPQIDRTFPTVSLTLVSALDPRALSWTPSLSFSRSDVLHMDQPASARTSSPSTPRPVRATASVKTLPIVDLVRHADPDLGRSSNLHINQRGTISRSNSRSMIEYRTGDESRVYAANTGPTSIGHRTSR